ncbi:hypothetical protein [Aureimonas sp. AU12]|jgi:hypothetical protein|nr:hypothetical protein [Aureimonas sp. AU12]
MARVGLLPEVIDGVGIMTYDHRIIVGRHVADDETAFVFAMIPALDPA